MDLTWIEANRQTADRITFHSRLRCFGVDIDSFATDRNQYSRVLVRRSRAGWPFRCLDGGSWDVIAEPAQKPWGETARVIAINAWLVRHGDDAGDVTPLPLKPMWPGMIGNVGFHWLTWTALLLLPIVIRGVVAFHRRSRGRCPCCKYDLRSDFAGGCPECGWRRAESAS